MDVDLLRRRPLGGDRPAALKRPDLLRSARRSPAPKQRRSRRRREAILASAMKRFGRDGYRRASMREIARAARVATGGVYRFFSSKRDLLLVSMDALLARLERISPPSFGGGAIRPQIEEFVVGIFARERPFIGVYRAWREAALVDASIAAHDRRIRAWTSARILRLFELFGRLPGARAGLDREVLAQLWDRFFWDLLADPPPDRARAARTISRTLYHTLFEDEPRG